MNTQELGKWVEENNALFTLKIDAQNKARLSQYGPESGFCAGQWHFRALLLVTRCRALYLACPLWLRKSAVQDELIAIALDDLCLREAA